VEIPLRSIEVDAPNQINVPLHSVDVDLTSKLSVDSTKCSSPEIVDLCESPKKFSIVQSRLSHFFRKPTNICDEQKKIVLEKQIDQLEDKSNYSPSVDSNVTSS